MDDNQFMIPRDLQKCIHHSQLIFVSVNPILDLSTVTEAIARVLASVTANETPINLPVDRMGELEGRLASPVILSCGNIIIREIPSYLRGVVESNAIDISNHPISSALWILIRVQIGDTQAKRIDYIGSADMEDSCISPIDQKMVNGHLFDAMKTLDNLEVPVIDKEEFIPDPNMEFKE